MAEAYPLAWPLGIPRTEGGRRGAAQFKTALDPALKNVSNSLRRFGDATGKPVASIVISTNYTLGDRSPRDPGVAVWFVWDGAERCIAVDRYPKIEHNLQAIHHVLEARVTEARHGGLQIVRQTFTGFVALPSPEMFGGKTPAQLLGLDGGGKPHSREDIVAAHRALAKQVHPDKAGSADEMAALNAARDALLKGLSA
ncbi:J domain-containing protein [Sphingobium cupriresistens]|uniref:J domain-containing protein n=1 Tax=Sphingobium cupriresistens TaxID=1132417 RepID=UPI003BAE0009